MADKLRFDGRVALITGAAQVFTIRFIKFTVKILQQANFYVFHYLSGADIIADN